MRFDRRWQVVLVSALVGAAWSPPVCGEGSSASLIDAVTRHVGEMVRQVDRNRAAVSIVVADLTDGRSLGAGYAATPLIPASIQKQLVMAAALEQLGPEFSFRTLVGMVGRDVVVIGDGDPGLGDPRLSRVEGEAPTSVLDRWAASLKGAGVSVVEGDLVVDESIFDGQWVHPSWEPGDLPKWYAAPVGGLNFADNCIELTAIPSGGRVRWELMPPNGIVNIENRAIPAKSGVPVIGRRGDTFTYVLSGACGSRATLQPLSVPDPGIFFAHSLRSALERNGVAVRGDVRRARVRHLDGGLPDGFRVLADHRTPLTDVLGRIGKNSQNFFAECLFKRLGFEFARRRGDVDPVGSWETGRAAVMDFLAGAGVATGGLVIADASGLSRDNRASAAQFVGLLRYMHHHRHRDLFVNAMAVAGEDGSLRSRLRDVAGAVVAKTGTMTGVRALSGYVHPEGGRPLAFCVIFNGIRGSSDPFKKMQDELCRLLVATAGTGSR